MFLVVAYDANDGNSGQRIKLRMARPTKIHADATPNRIHFIPEWADRRQMKAADLVRELGVDKGTVSRWFNGQLPREHHLVALAGLFGTDVAGLFRHPDDDWLARFLRDRSTAEKKRIEQTLDIAFPKKAS